MIQQRVAFFSKTSALSVQRSNILPCQIFMLNYKQPRDLQTITTAELSGKTSPSMRTLSLSLPTPSLSTMTQQGPQTCHPWGFLLSQFPGPVAGILWSQSQKLAAVVKSFYGGVDLRNSSTFNENLCQQRTMMVMHSGLRGYNVGACSWVGRNIRVKTLRNIVP